MKCGQLSGHSCFRIEMRTRLSLLRKVLFVLRAVSELEFSMIKLTTKLRIPKEQNLVREQRPGRVEGAHPGIGRVAGSSSES